ncbi:CP4-44 prophage; predicted disrupted hemin or colicin receptor [Escherichia coli]|nr:CP4-44 prophage; predicted disrupted hemin or colicin receptor [Escherichia coli]SQM26702.1 CP4-44 prophage; predicted disrupted hemin or colicin receptor [Escherichia coli]
MSSLITNTNISLHDLKVMWSSNRDVSLTETEDVRNIWLKIKDFFTQTNSNEIARLILINRHMMISSTGESNDTRSLNGTFSELYRNVTSNLKDGINFHLETTNQDNTSMCYWICPYISRHLLSLNPLQARCRRYSRGER